MNQKSQQKPRKISLEDLLRNELSIDYLDETVESPDGVSLRSRVVEVGTADDAGNPISFLLRRQRVQNTGEIVAAQEAKAYCFHCKSFSRSKSVVPCRGCQVSTCPACRVQRQDGTVWHAACSRRDKLSRVVRSLLLFPLRFFIAQVEDKNP